MSKIKWNLVSLILFLICMWQMYFIYVPPRFSSRFLDLQHGQVANDHIVHEHIESRNSSKLRRQFSKSRNIYIPNMRVAILVPFVGQYLPAWFDGFLASAQASSDLFDWYIFITEANAREVPGNVKLISMTRKELCQRIARIDTSNDIFSRIGINMSTVIEKLFETSTYVLVELKPCLVTIFSVSR